MHPSRQEISDVDPPETRLLPRLIAGLSELGCAAWLWWVWLNPERAGMDGVLAAFAVVVLEGPLLVCLVTLFLFADAKAGFKERASGVVLFGFSIWLAIGMATRIVDMVPGPNLYLFGVVAAVFVGKWMLYQDGRRNNPGWEIAKIFIQGVVLIVCVGLATSFASRLGFDADTVASMGIPERMNLLGEPLEAFDPRGPASFYPPWRVIAGGVFYFALYGAFRFLTLTRSPRTHAADPRVMP